MQIEFYVMNGVLRQSKQAQDIEYILMLKSHLCLCIWEIANFVSDVRILTEKYIYFRPVSYILVVMLPDLFVWYWGLDSVWDHFRSLSMFHCHISLPYSTLILSSHPIFGFSNWLISIKSFIYRNSLNFWPLGTFYISLS